jgi:hypothetical protein
MSKKQKNPFENLKEGAFTNYCKNKGHNSVTQSCIDEGKKSKDQKTRKRAILAENFQEMAKKKKS